MRIIHFSDIHLGAWPQSPRAFFDKRFLGLLNYTIRRRPHLHEDYVRKAIDRITGLAPDCVICSGDITCIGSPTEFNKARELLAPLIETTDFDFLYVPGNHDVYVNDRQCRTALETTFRYMNRNRWQLEQLPVCYQTWQMEVLLVNECRPTPIVGSYGILDEKTRQVLPEWLGQDRAPGHVRALVGHFPTRHSHGKVLAKRRRLYHGDAIHRALRSGELDLYFCGHIHDPYINRFETGSLEMCAGSLTTHGCLNLVEISDTRKITQKWENVIAQ